MSYLHNLSFSRQNTDMCVFIRQATEIAMDMIKNNQLEELRRFSNELTSFLKDWKAALENSITEHYEDIEPQIISLLEKHDQILHSAAGVVNRRQVNRDGLGFILKYCVLGAGVLAGAAGVSVHNSAAGENAPVIERLEKDPLRGILGRDRIDVDSYEMIAVMLEDLANRQNAGFDENAQKKLREEAQSARLSIEALIESEKNEKKLALGIALVVFGSIACMVALTYDTKSCDMNAIQLRNNDFVNILESLQGVVSNVLKNNGPSVE